MTTVNGHGMTRYIYMFMVAVRTLNAGRNGGEEWIGLGDRCDSARYIVSGGEGRSELDRAAIEDAGTARRLRNKTAVVEAVLWKVNIGAEKVFYKQFLRGYECSTACSNKSIYVIKIVETAVVADSSGRARGSIQSGRSDGFGIGLAWDDKVVP